MARKVKDTPVLKGRDARAFLKALEENKDKKVSVADYQRAQQNAKRFKIVL